MGFFDFFKKKASTTEREQIIQNTSVAQTGVVHEDNGRSVAYHFQPAPQEADGMFSFEGDTFPIPTGWEDLCASDWFFKYETLRDEITGADEMNLPSMSDEDGDSLDSEEVFLIEKCGFQSANHYETYCTFSMLKFANGEDYTDYTFRMSGIARERLMANKANAMSAPGGPLVPVEGVSCQDWAGVQAKIAGGGDHAALIAAAGFDDAKWQRVNTEWTARMSSDTTGTIVKVYGDAFAVGSTGQFSGQAGQAATTGIAGDLSDEPVSFERWIELTEAYNAGVARGEEAGGVLQGLGLSIADWSNIGAFWSVKFNQNAGQYFEQHQTLTIKYKAIYGGGDGLTDNEREEKVMWEIGQLALQDKGNEIIPLVRGYYPDDDDYYIGSLIERVCRNCVAAAEAGHTVEGNKRICRVLLTTCHPLMDSGEPLASWVADELESMFDGL